MTVTRAVHELKTWPAYFSAIRLGTKRFEIRKNDRDFQVGDELVLLEFDPEADALTGQEERRLVSFLLSEEALGVIHGFVVIGFGDLPIAAPAGDVDMTCRALADWHASNAAVAAQRAKNARSLALSYDQAVAGRQRMPVAADRQNAVADAAEAEALFHGAAARLVKEIAHG